MPTEGQFFSNISARPQKDGGLLLILDSSKLNEHLVCNHFKMESFETAVRFITKDCFLASPDLKDAYFPVSIHRSSETYLR